MTKSAVALMVILGCSCGGSTTCVEADRIGVFPDNDGDGFGATGAMPTMICPGDPIPPGFADKDGDCADDDPRAFPGQIAYQTMPLSHPNLFHSSWDFDCDGFATKQWEATGVCSQGDGYCSIYTAPNIVGGYWSVNAIDQAAPDCGTTGVWVFWCRAPDRFCIIDSESRVQGCL